MNQDGTEIGKSEVLPSQVKSFVKKVKSSQVKSYFTQKIVKSTQVKS